MWTSCSGRHEGNAPDSIPGAPNGVGSIFLMLEATNCMLPTTIGDNLMPDSNFQLVVHLNTSPSPFPYPPNSSPKSSE
jgi:hypothetical protein